MDVSDPVQPGTSTSMFAAAPTDGQAQPCSVSASSQGTVSIVIDGVSFFPATVEKRLTDVYRDYSRKAF